MTTSEHSVGRTHKVTRSLAKKALAPVAASAAAYAAKKLPQLYEEKIAPKLRERGGARAVVEDATQRVGTQVQQAKETVSSKAADSPIASVVTAKPTGGNGASGGASDEKRDEARQKRAQNRQRRKAST